MSRTTQIGLEPTTFAVTGRRSNQLSHWAFSKGYIPSKPHTLNIYTSYHTFFPNTTIFCKTFVLHFRSSPRPISNSQLHALRHFHLCPIYLVVFKGSYFFRMGYLILRGASRLDAFSVYPFPTWLPGREPGGSTGTPEVSPSRSSRTKDSSSQISYSHNG